jgi:hypothetical protein
MSTNPIVNIYTNPFDEKERETILLENKTSIIEFLCQKFPTGFKRATRVYLNDKQIEPDSFNTQLSNNDRLDIKIWPEEPSTTAIVLAAIAGGVAAVVVMNNNKPTIPTIDQPEQLSNLKKPGGNAYNLREQTNLARLNEPIPSQYGKVKWFPDLAASPYVRFENNIPVVRYLLCLGHGQHQIDDILIGPTSILNSDDVTSTLYNPGDTMTEFSDNVFTLPDKKNMAFNSAAKKMVQCDHINFHKTNKHITFPDDASKLTNVFEEDDEIYVYSTESTDFNGVFVIHSVTDQRITVQDSSAWLSEDNTIDAQIYLKDNVIVNPFRTEDENRLDQDKRLGYLVNGAHTGIVTFENPYLKSIRLELDFESPQGFYSINYALANNFDEDDKGGIFEIDSYLFGLDSDENRINNHYKLRYVEEMDEINSTTFQVPALYRNWTDPSLLPSDIKFPTISTDNFFYFTEDDVQIDESDISSIDYVNGSVIFNTSKTGTIKVHNFIIYYAYTDSIQWDINYPISSDYIGLNKLQSANPSNANITLESDIFKFRTGVTQYEGEYNIHTKYQMLVLTKADYRQTSPFSSTRYLKGGQGYKNIFDNVHINRIKLVYPDVKEYPNVSLLALTINNTPAQQYTESNNVAVISTRKLQQYDGASWSAPTATRSIAWAIADMLMSTYGASKPQSEIDLTKLIALESTFSSRGDTFDGVFDSFVDIWEAVNKVARAGRTKCILDNNMVRFVRDEAQSVYKAAYNVNNILPNSFAINHTFSNVDSVRGVKVKFNDEDDQYTPTEVYSSENKGKYQEIDFFGVVNYNQAWRESQYLEKQILTSGIEVSFKTGLYGHIPFYGDLISLQYDLPNWGQGGYVVEKRFGYTEIKLSEDLDTTEPGPYYILFTKHDGSTSGPHLLNTLSWESQRRLYLPFSLVEATFFRTIENNQNPTAYQLGPLQNYNKPCVVTGIKANKDNETLSLSVIPYNADIHTADTGIPPAKPSVTPNLLPIPPLVGGLVLSNVPESGSVVANWNPLSNIDNYKVQKSTDNVTYTDVSTPTVPTETISATGVLYVRVASVIDSTIGRYNVAVIKAT